MKCSQIKTRFSAYLSGEMQEIGREEVQRHVTECESCREELESLGAVWAKLGILPEEQPGNDVRKRFYTMLEECQQGLKEEKSRSGIRAIFGEGFTNWSQGRPAFQLTFVLILLIVGLTAGYFLHSLQGRGEEIAQLRQELSLIRQIASVSLLRQESLTEQMRGVGLTPRAERLDRETLDALLRLIGNESEFSLSSEALRPPFPVSGYPVIDQEFVNTLSEQASPLVEVALSLMGRRF
jgi:hypothetical protein